MSTRRSKLKELVGKIEGTQALMIAYVTGERASTQPAEYQELYYQLDVDLEELGYANPNQHKSLEAFWSFCKLKELDTYASRRTYVREIYADVLLDIERALRKDSGNWQQGSQKAEANEIIRPSSATYQPPGKIVETPSDIEAVLFTLV